ncbi:hypothetical protein HDU78_011241 [Chytriomyces hyalinus]|nr:hypothetical protein HDU78_011241 [Chytriomyces hyalinus]
MLGQPRRTRSVTFTPTSKPSTSSHATTTPTAASPTAKSKPKPKKEFDTSVSNLAALKLTPDEKLRKKLAREVYTNSHRPATPAAPLAVQKPESSMANTDGIDQTLLRRTPVRSVPAAVVGQKSSDVVDFQSELKQFDQSAAIANNKASTVRERRNTQPAMHPVSSSKKASLSSFDSAETVPHVIQTKLILLFESLDNLSKAMGNSNVLDDVEAAETESSVPEDSEFQILSRALTSATVTASSATRYVQNNFLRMDSLAGSISRVAQKVAQMDSALKDMQAQMIVQADAASKTEYRMDQVEHVAKVGVELVLDEMDILKRECQAVGLGREVQDTLRDILSAE